VLKDAYSKATHNQFSDDASVVEATGKDIALVEGNIENIKVTSPIDLQLASLLIS
jgi:2-C-methyl-D-erythritol 4-phosphate cytidylyltransferase